MIYLFQACARTGHSTGTNLYSYLNSLNLLKGLPGAHAFHGYNQIHMKVVLPDIDMIVAMNQAAAERLIQFFLAPLLSKSFIK